MAAIDKMWGNEAEHKQLLRFVRGKGHKLSRRVFGPEHIMEMPADETRSIANFGYRQDQFLVRKCSIPFVLQNLLWQYTERHKIGRIARDRLVAMGESTKRRGWDED